MTTQLKSLDVSRLVASVGNRIFAAISLIYFAPLMLAVAVLIKLDSDGPVFMRHIRLGAGGETVSLWEFRTMVAIGIGYGSGAEQTVLGAFLRDSRLDLLPRLINVLRGEVSFSALLR